MTNKQTEIKEKAWLKTTPKFSYGYCEKLKLLNYYFQNIFRYIAL